MTLEIGEVSWARARRDLRLSAPNRPGNLCVARDIERSDQLLREEPRRSLALIMALAVRQVFEKWRGPYWI